MGHNEAVAHDDRIAAATGTGFAERLLEVIDSGRRTATYKLALLLAILDLCSLRSDADGFAPTDLTTRDLAEQVASLYWMQVAPFRLEASSEALDLRQITNKSSLVIDAVRGFRSAVEPAGATSLWIARQRFPSEYSDVIDRIERTLAEQPLPRLQTVGTSETVFPFIYDLGPDWGANQHFSVQRLRNHGPKGPVIPMLPGAGDELVRLAPLIRPWSSSTGPEWSPTSTGWPPSRRIYVTTSSDLLGLFRPRCCVTGYGISRTIGASTATVR